MKKKSLKKFNPNTMARLDLNMWRAYYSHNFLQLFLLLWQLMHGFFGFNIIRAVKAAYYAAYAAIEFRIRKGNENTEKILEKLTRFYEVMSRNSVEKFDYKKAAQFELEWWMIDRYPERYEITREEALAHTMAVIYGVDHIQLLEYAKYRAEAMVVHDVAEAHGQKTDWKKIGMLLKLSFNSLHKNVQ